MGQFKLTEETTMIDFENAIVGDNGKRMYYGFKDMIIDIINTKMNKGQWYRYSEIMLFIRRHKDFNVDYDRVSTPTLNIMLFKGLGLKHQHGCGTTGRFKNE